jgi:hypothetical protein
MRPTSLHLVRPEPEHARAPATSAGRGDRGDLGLMALLFGLSLVPLALATLGLGDFGAGTLGVATAGVLVTGRELALGTRSILHRRR